MKYLTRSTRFASTRAAENNARAKALADTLQAEDVSSIYSQPSYGGGRYRPNDPNDEPERSPDQVAAVVDNAGGSIAAGIRSRLDNTGAPPAPNSGNTGDPTARNIIRQTLARR